MPDWTCNLGEQPNFVAVHLNRYTRQYDIVVACDQTFFIANDRGLLRYQRRLEFTPSCLLTYHLPKSGADIYEDDSRNRGQVMTDARENNTLDTPCFMTLMGSFNNFLMVFRDVRLAWAAKTSTAPIYIERAMFEEQDGLIVTMSDQGFL